MAVATRDSVAPHAFFQGLQRPLYITNASNSSLASSSSASSMPSLQGMERSVMPFQKFVVRNAAAPAPKQAPPRLRRRVSSVYTHELPQFPAQKSPRRAYIDGQHTAVASYSTSDLPAQSASLVQDDPQILRPDLVRDRSNSSSVSSPSGRHSVANIFILAPKTYKPPKKSIKGGTPSTHPKRLLGTSSSAQKLGAASLPSAGTYRASQFTPPPAVFATTPPHSPAFDLFDDTPNIEEQLQSEDLFPKPLRLPNTSLRRVDRTIIPHRNESLQPSQPTSLIRTASNTTTDSLASSSSLSLSQSLTPSILDLTYHAILSEQAHTEHAQAEAQAHSQAQTSTPTQLSSSTTPRTTRHRRNKSSTSSSILSLSASLRSRKVLAFPNTAAGKLRAHLPLRIPSPRRNNTLSPSSAKSNTITSLSTPQSTLSPSPSPSSGTSSRKLIDLKRAASVLDKHFLSNNDKTQERLAQRRREDLKKSIRVTGPPDPRALLTAQRLRATDLGVLGPGI